VEARASVVGASRVAPERPRVPADLRRMRVSTGASEMWDNHNAGAEDVEMEETSGDTVPQLGQARPQTRAPPQRSPTDPGLQRKSSAKMTLQDSVKRLTTIATRRSGGSSTSTPMESPALPPRDFTNGSPRSSSTSHLPVPGLKAVGILAGKEVPRAWVDRLCRALGRALASIRRPELGVDFGVVGGLPGAAESVTRAFMEATHETTVVRDRVFHVLPEGITLEGLGGAAPAWDFGTTLHWGATLQERAILVAQRCDVLLLIGGDVTVARARNAGVESGALVLPIKSTGGAAAGEHGGGHGFSFCPNGVAHSEWAALSATVADDGEEQDSSIRSIAQAAAHIIENEMRAIRSPSVTQPREIIADHDRGVVGAAFAVSTKLEGKIHIRRRDIVAKALEDVAAAADAQLRWASSSLTPLEDKLSEAEAEIQQGTTKEEKLIQQIRDAYEEHIDRLNREVEDLIKQVADRVNQALVPLRTARAELGKRIDDIRSGEELATEVSRAVAAVARDEESGPHVHLADLLSAKDALAEAFEELKVDTAIPSVAGFLDSIRVDISEPTVRTLRDRPPLARLVGGRPADGPNVPVSQTSSTENLPTAVMMDPGNSQGYLDKLVLKHTLGVAFNRPAAVEIVPAESDSVDFDPTNPQCWNIVVSDSGNGQLRRFTAEGTMLQAIAMDAVWARTGRPVDTGVLPEHRPCPWGLAYLRNLPHGLSTADSSKHGLAVADFNRHAVLVLSLKGPAESKVMMLGNAGDHFVNFDGSLLRPKGICIDGQGNLYVCDSGNHRVQVFDTRSGDYIRKFGYGHLNDPSGVALVHPEDSCTDVAVSDTGHHCVQIFNSNGDVVRRISLTSQVPGKNARLGSPAQVCCIDGVLCVADTGRDRILVANCGDLNSVTGEMSPVDSPKGLAFLPKCGLLVVAKAYSEEVQIFVHSQYVSRYRFGGESRRQAIGKAVVPGVRRPRHSVNTDGKGRR